MILWSQDGFDSHPMANAVEISRKCPNRPKPLGVPRISVMSNTPLEFLSDSLGFANMGQSSIMWVRVWRGVPHGQG